MVKCVGLETGFDRRPKTLGALFPTVERLSQAHVANSELKKRSRAPYTDKILQETYRLELIELIKGHAVLLCTVRKEMYRDITLRTIAQKCNGWQPHEAYFNSIDTWHGDIVKAEYLEKLIFPKHGTPDEQKYYAIESATRTRGMYKRYDIPADPVGKKMAWTRLPYYAELSGMD